MKKKILSLILALLMLVPNVTAFAEFDNEKFDKLDMKAMEADENQKVKDLIFCELMVICTYTIKR